MGSKWYVTPQTVRLHLKDGESIDVKEELTIGERNAVLSASGKFVDVGGAVTRVIDPQGFYFERAAAYIVGWSATDEKDGKKVPIPFTRKALAQLPLGLYNEILDAVSAHVAKMGEAPEPGSVEEKNEKSGEDTSKSSSASAAS